MPKTTKLVAALGIATAFSITAVPLASSFADTTVSGSPVSEEIKYAVSSSLSITVGVTSGAVDPTAATEVSAGGSLDTKGNDVKVSGNNNFKVTVKDSDATTALTNGKGGTIATYTADKTSLADPGWGITMTGTCASGHTCGLTAGTYKGMPASSGTAITIYQRTATSASFTNDTIAVKYGIKTASTQPAGTYSDTITYTVAAS